MPQKNGDIENNDDCDASVKEKQTKQRSKQKRRRTKLRKKKKTQKTSHEKSRRFFLFSNISGIQAAVMTLLSCVRVYMYVSNPCVFFFFASATYVQSEKYQYMCTHAVNILKKSRQNNNKKTFSSAFILETVKSIPKKKKTTKTKKNGQAIVENNAE